jgi:hypothetical protein
VSHFRRQTPTLSGNVAFPDTTTPVIRPRQHSNIPAQISESSRNSCQFY